MLSTHQQAGRLRYASNLLPTAGGALASRPGARQILDGNITWAQGWGSRLAAARDGDVVIYESPTALYNIMRATDRMSASAFQALIADATREDRLYFADGVNSLWYVAKSGNVFVRTEVVNTVLDPSSDPYPIEIPTVIATWRNRLWIGWGTNRIQHCQNEAPEAWDPLWVVEFQNAHDDQVHALTPHASVLLAGLDHSLWAVSGTSQYNWARDEIRSAAGPDGVGALVSDGARAYWVSQSGVFSLDGLGTLSEDLRELFSASTYACTAVMDARRELLLFTRNGRALAMHLTTGFFGELCDVGAVGVFNLNGEIGWYGADGAWLLTTLDAPDVRKNGVETDVVSVYDTWEDRPNLDGNGRALLSRAALAVKGSTRGELTYTATAAGADGVTEFEDTATLADESSPYTPTEDMTGALGEPWWPTKPVRREFSPKIAGETFRHRIEAPCHIEIQQFAPKYRFKRPE